MEKQVSEERTNEVTDDDLVLSVQNLTTHFNTPAGTVRAAEEVNFDLAKGEILAIVGESGSGKSVTALSLMKLVPVPPGNYVNGKILIEGKDVLTATDSELERVRGEKISMIFQNPRAALNPSLTVLSQMVETIRRHSPKSTKAGAARLAYDYMRSVGVPEAERVGDSYPHQISGGMCQRVGLAMAISCRPTILIADEPTTQLDAHVQAKILLTLKRTHQENRLPIILITHDFGVVRALATRIIVMYAGKIQEEGAAEDIFSRPQHPYTKALIDSVPRPDANVERLYQIPGQPPNLARLPKGCSFAERCPEVMEVCHERMPEMSQTPANTCARCHLFAPSE